MSIEKHDTPDPLTAARENRRVLPMNQRGPLGFFLLMFELVRAAALAAAFLRFPGTAGAAPYAALAAPNALFALMALFLYMDRERYGAYLPLYISGKVVVFSAMLVWSISSFRAILSSLVMDDTAALIVLCAGLIPADALSLIAATALSGGGRTRSGGTRQDGAQVGRPTADLEVLDAGDTFLGGR